MGTPWKLLSGSVAGTSHRRRGEPSQDYSAGRVLGTAGSAVLVVACADGAGSAPHAALGARAACLTFLHAATTALEGGLPVSDVTEQHVRNWHEQARRRLSLEACLRNLDLADLACTLLTAVAGEAEAVFSQVGDGAIVFRDGDGYRTAFWPQSGEYANTTFFLTSPGYEGRLAFRRTPHGVGELALLTDGLQPLALHYASRSVHGPFFDPLFGALRGAPDPEGLEAPLRQFLTSAPVNARTDDDKTLILATRRPPSP